MSRFFKYTLLFTFLCSVLLIVFLQYNSNRNINLLINGNEELLSELQFKNELQRLQTGIVGLESKMRGAVISGNRTDSSFLDREGALLQHVLGKLKPFNNDTSIAILLTQLNRLVNTKIAFNKVVLKAYSKQGKYAAEKLVNTQYGYKLTDSIKNIAQNIDDIHELDVTALIKAADNSGRKARTLGTIMALMAAIAAVFSFLYVAYKVRQQQQFIQQLNDSEKKAREAVAIKENFLANMSHEIRTPMNAILGFTNLLQRQRLNDTSKEYVQNIQKSGENLLSIINDILDLSKIEAGMMRIEVGSFSIRGLLHSLEMMFKTAATEKNIVLSCSVDNSVPDTIEGDAMRLTQILVNLIGNALKFTSLGSINVCITNEGIIGDTVKTGIQVSDTGIGIEPEKLPNIFERFQQADAAVTRKFGGSGLGLSIVKDLILLQRGTINAKSVKGKGTTFFVMIPYKISEEQFTKLSELEITTGTVTPFANNGNIRILIVEDNSINQSLLRHLFVEWKLEFDIADNGLQALDALKKNSYHLILMDMQMPEMDGYTAAQEIRQHLKLSIPIIAMTAHAMPGEREKCISFGMNEYVPKPIKEEQLCQLIKRFTELEPLAFVQRAKIANSNKLQYEWINLEYLRSISNGNCEYEKLMIGKFIKAIPESMLLLKKASEENNVALLRQTAHNMKTTISVMGLNSKLDTFLDALELNSLTQEEYFQKINTLQAIMDKAMKEVEGFYSKL